jgi:hypothetical protein
MSWFKNKIASITNTKLVGRMSNVKNDKWSDLSILEIFIYSANRGLGYRIEFRHYGVAFPVHHGTSFTELYRNEGFSTKIECLNDLTIQVGEAFKVFGDSKFILNKDEAKLIFDRRTRDWVEFFE